MNCPSCASTMVENKNFNGEMSCNDCGAEFAYKYDKLNLYVPGTYEKLCDSVVTHIATNVSDPMIISSLKKNSIGYINEGSSKIDSFIDMLAEEADILYSQYNAGKKDKTDFCSYMEAINKLLEWKKINEAGFLGISGMPTVSVSTPHIPGQEDELPEHEREESEAIEKAQDALEDLNAAIGDMQAAQTSELGGVPVDCGFPGSDCEPEVGLSSPITPAIPELGADLGADATAIPAVEPVAPVLAEPEVNPVSLDATLPPENPVDDIPSENPEEEEEEEKDSRFESDEFLTNENVSFRVGDSVFLEKNEQEKWKIIGIKAKENKLFVKFNEQTQVIDIENDDIDVRLAEDLDIYAERVSNSEDRMKNIWLEMEKRIDAAKSFVNNRGWDPVNEEVEDAEGADKPIEDGEGGGQDEGEASPAAPVGDRHGEYVKDTEDAEGADKPIEDGEGGTQLDEPIEESVIGDHFHNSVGEKRPFPFTQDPTNNNNDHFDEKELGDLEVKNRLQKADDEDVVDVDDAVTPKKATVGGGEDMGDSINYLKISDLIYVKENYKTQWEVSRVDGPNKVYLKSGKKTCMINPAVDSYAHVDGVSLAWEREESRINESKNIWAEMEKTLVEDNKSLAPAGYVLKESAQKCDINGENCEDTEEVDQRPVLEKADLYEAIKSSEIHRQPRSKALQKLVSQYGNNLQEMIAVFEDAVASEFAGNEKIEDLYGYKKPNELDTKFKLEDAWQEIEKKEKEDAEKAQQVEEGLTDNSDNGNAEKQIAIGKNGLNSRDKRGGFSINL